MKRRTFLGLGAATAISASLPSFGRKIKPLRILVLGGTRLSGGVVELPRLALRDRIALGVQRALGRVTGLVWAPLVIAVMHVVYGWRIADVAALRRQYQALRREGGPLARPATDASAGGDTARYARCTGPPRGSGPGGGSRRGAGHTANRAGGPGGSRSGRGSNPIGRRSRTADS